LLLGSARVGTALAPFVLFGETVRVEREDQEEHKPDEDILYQGSESVEQYGAGEASSLLRGR